MVALPSADAALVAALAAGSEAALAELYDRHVDAVHAAAFRLLGDRQAAEDVVQEVFLTLWNRADRFDPALGSLPAWLLTIARNRAVDRLRAAGRRPRLVSIPPAAGEDEPDAAALERLAAERGILGWAGSADADPEAALELAETGAALRRTLAALPETERTAILLAYHDGLTQSEIAARLGWPLGTVKTRTRRALSRLRDALGPEFAPVPGPAAGAPEAR
ncbi:MAG: sigma-70 family RNA polymerase sigma factor [Chloroflexi bacterium]|nr:sigma-70 family RNA polymerase sigma factor [Chloroflexota bacterium]